MLDFLKSVADFILLTVVVKIIIGHWVAERIMLLSKKYSAKPSATWPSGCTIKPRPPVTATIAQSVLSCGEDKCGIFRA
jgi:hypothetical protein